MKILVYGPKARYDAYMPDFAAQLGAELVFCTLDQSPRQAAAENPDAQVLFDDPIVDVGREIIDLLPNLKLIQSEGVAFNRIDLEAAKEKGIFVCNNKGCNADSVAEHTIMLMLMALRHGITGHNAVKAGRQVQMKEAVMASGSPELGEQTVGLVGFGDIAQATAQRLKPFGCKLYYYSLHRRSPEVEADFGVEYLPLEELAAACDILSLHCAVNDQTRDMVNAELVAKMKPGIILVNTARGDLVDNLAVRQGLMEAESILLEPWYDFRLEVPAESVGRALSDVQRMGGDASPPEILGQDALLTGAAPVAGMRDYAREVAAYTRGRGRLFCTLKGYEPCREQERVVAESGYDPRRDLDNPADSVFCDHGAGFAVPWNQVKARAHVDSGLRLGETGPEGEKPAPAQRRTYADSLARDKELQAIFERTYGKVEPRAFQPAKKPARTSLDGEHYAIQARQAGPEYLLVDGYNIIFAWEELQTVARDNLDAARQLLMDLLSNYQGFRRCEVILVFDAYKVPRSLGEVVKYHNIYVVYTKEAETADAYIEKTTYELGKKHRVRVATSDGAEQLIILGHGALRLSASAFKAEVEQVEGQISAVLARNNRREKSRTVESALHRAAKRRDGERGGG